MEELQVRIKYFLVQYVELNSRMKTRVISSNRDFDCCCLLQWQFAGFNPLEMSTYLDPSLIWGRSVNFWMLFFALFFIGCHISYIYQRPPLLQFDRFRWIFHHSTYRVLLGHRERGLMFSFFHYLVTEWCFNFQVSSYGSGSNS